MLYKFPCCRLSNELESLKSGFDESPVHIANNEMAYGSKNIKELLREAKIGGQHGVKRKSCKVHRAYCMTGMPNSSWHLAMLQRNTCTFSKVTGRPSSANTAYVSSPLQSTTPGQQVGRTSLGAPFQVFLLSCILGLVLPSSYNVAVMRVRVHVSNLHLDKNKQWLNLTSLFGNLRVAAHMSKSYYRCLTLHPQAHPPAHPQSQPSQWHQTWASPQERITPRVLGDLLQGYEVP